MSKPWKRRGHHLWVKGPQVPSWLYATFEELSKSLFSQVVLSCDKPEKGTPAIILHPLLIHKENTIYLDCKSGVVTRKEGSLNHNSQGTFHKAPQRASHVLLNRGLPAHSGRRPELKATAANAEQSHPQHGAREKTGTTRWRRTWPGNLGDMVTELG